jgi:2-dehydro-3-deoxyphosphogluconate aldolase / (4S)-4-hydroxy-2-oxoglutarate aldolase
VNVVSAAREPQPGDSGEPPRRIAVTPELAASHVVAILRAHGARHVQPVVETLAESGLTCLELTFTIPGMPSVLARLTSHGPSGVTIGAGTVTTMAQARAARDAGAAFLVSPMLCADVLEYSLDEEVPCYPGAWTPTEVATAWRMGASAVKLFPAGTGGVAHLRHLREPFGDIPFVPTGGVDAASAAAYLEAGAIAVGVGGRLIGDALTGGDLAELAARARQFMTALDTG